MPTIRVVARFRPINKVELGEAKNSGWTHDQLCPIWVDNKNLMDFTECADNEKHGSEVRCVTSERSDNRFAFDKILVWVSQQEAFNSIALPVVKDALDGINGTIFAYGQTGSGKTYSMLGPEPLTLQNIEGIGLIPRTVDYLFRELQSDENLKSYAVTVSFFEIYIHNSIRDLIVPDPKGVKKLKIRDTSKGVSVENLTKHKCRDVDDVIHYIGIANGNRQVSKTRMNATSSRSHSIMTLNIGVERMDGLKCQSKLNFGDLAGSEKVGKTEATGQRLAEAQAINQSLTLLGNCIAALVKLSMGKNVAIPFRDSALTHVLKESLAGNTKTTVLIGASPHKYNIFETVSSFRFGARCKFVKTKVKKNQQLSPLQMRKLIKDLKSENTRLRRELETGGGGGKTVDFASLFQSNHTDSTYGIRILSEGGIPKPEELHDWNESVKMEVESMVNKAMPPEGRFKFSVKGDFNTKQKLFTIAVAPPDEQPTAINTSVYVPVLDEVVARVKKGFDVPDVILKIREIKTFGPHLSTASDGLEGEGDSVQLQDLQREIEWRDTEIERMKRELSSMDEGGGGDRSGHHSRRHTTVTTANLFQGMSTADSDAFQKRIHDITAKMGTGEDNSTTIGEIQKEVAKRITKLETERTDHIQRTRELLQRCFVSERRADAEGQRAQLMSSTQEFYLQQISDLRSELHFDDLTRQKYSFRLEFAEGEIDSGNLNAAWVPGPVMDEWIKNIQLEDDADTDKDSGAGNGASADRNRAETAPANAVIPSTALIGGGINKFQIEKYNRGAMGSSKAVPRSEIGRVLRRSSIVAHSMMRVAEKNRGAPTVLKQRSSNRKDKKEEKKVTIDEAEVAKQVEQELKSKDKRKSKKGKRRQESMHLSLQPSLGTSAGNQSALERMGLLGNGSAVTNKEFGSDMFFFADNDFAGGQSSDDDDFGLGLGSTNKAPKRKRKMSQNVLDLDVFGQLDVLDIIGKATSDLAVDTPSLRIFAKIEKQSNATPSNVIDSQWLVSIGCSGRHAIKVSGLLLKASKLLLAEQGQLPRAKSIWVNDDSDSGGGSSIGGDDNDSIFDDGDSLSDEDKDDNSIGHLGDNSMWDDILKDLLDEDEDIRAAIDDSITPSAEPGASTETKKAQSGGKSVNKATEQHFKAYGRYARKLFTTDEVKQLAQLDKISMAGHVGNQYCTFTELCNQYDIGFSRRLLLLASSLFLSGNCPYFSYDSWNRWLDLCLSLASNPATAGDNDDDNDNEGAVIFEDLSIDISEAPIRNLSNETDTKESNVDSFDDENFELNDLTIDETGEMNEFVAAYWIRKIREEPHTIVDDEGNEFPIDSVWVEKSLDDVRPDDLAMQLLTGFPYNELQQLFSKCPLQLLSILKNGFQYELTVRFLLSSRIDPHTTSIPDFCDLTAVPPDALKSTLKFMDIRYAPAFNMTEFFDKIDLYMGVNYKPELSMVRQCLDAKENELAGVTRNAYNADDNSIGGDTADNRSLPSIAGMEDMGLGFSDSHSTISFNSDYSGSEKRATLGMTPEIISKFLMFGHSTGFSLLPDEAFYASSAHSLVGNSRANYKPAKGPMAWVPSFGKNKKKKKTSNADNLPTQWITVDLCAQSNSYKKTVFAILLQPRGDKQEFVKRATVSVSLNNENFEEVPQLEIVNMDGRPIVIKHLATPITARYVRLTAMEWFVSPSLRWDLCYSDD